MLLDSRCRKTGHDVPHQRTVSSSSLRDMETLPVAVTIIIRLRSGNPWRGDHLGIGYIAQIYSETEMLERT